MLKRSPCRAESAQKPRPGSRCGPGDSVSCAFTAGNTQQESDDGPLAQLACPDKWKDGSREQSSGGRKLNVNKLLMKRTGCALARVLLCVLARFARRLLGGLPGSGADHLLCSVAGSAPSARRARARCTSRRPCTARGAHTPRASARCAGRRFSTLRSISSPSERSFCGAFGHDQFGVLPRSLFGFKHLIALVPCFLGACSVLSTSLPWCLPSCGILYDDARLLCARRSAGIWDDPCILVSLIRVYIS